MYGSTRSFFIIALVVLVLCILAKAAPYQELEPRKGHVPVYIRHGDEALSNIHPGLAEAFKEEPSSQPLPMAENLITEQPDVKATELPSQSESESKTESVSESESESDIADFDAIKAMETQ